MPSDRHDTAAILIVEDHPATRKAVMALLAGAFPRCRLIGAGSAEAALPLCEAELPRVVVMDIALPGMNGIEATRLIRARHPDTRVVMHSSSDQQIFRDESIAVGASAFVGKGARSGDLVPVLAGLLRS